MVRGRVSLFVALFVATCVHIKVQLSTDAFATKNKGSSQWVLEISELENLDSVARYLNGDSLYNT